MAVTTRAMENMRKISHPLVRQFFAIQLSSKKTRTEVAERAGIGVGTINFWALQRRSPSLLTFEAALGALGCKLKIVWEDEDDASNQPRTHIGL